MFMGGERAKRAAFDATATTPLTPATLVMLVNQQKLQLTHQNVESILPMTKSVWSWDGSVFSLLLKHMAMGVKRPKTLSHDWHLFFQSADAARSLGSSMVSSISF